VAGSVAYLGAGIWNLVGHSPARVRHIESVLDVEHVGQFNPRTWKMLGKFYYNLPKGTHSIKAT